MFYGTVTGFTEYHTARGRDVSEYPDARIETSLLVASEWLDGAFVDRFGGYRVDQTINQVREWPRTYTFYSDGFPISALSVPVEIEYATYEAAYRHLQNPNALLADFTPQKYKRVTVDGAVTVEYRMLDATTAQQQFPIIGQILGRLFGGRGNVSPLSSGTVRV